MNLILSAILLFLPLVVSAGWRKTVPEVNCKELYATTYGPTQREGEQLKRGQDFFDIISPIPQWADDQNQVVLKALESEPIPKNIASRRKGELTIQEADDLFAQIKEVPQVKETTLCNERYKNSERQGFCFGRSIAAHLKALQFGLHNKSIRKVWAVGRLDMDGLEWKYHVTTIVRMKGGEWYALDPAFEKPMPVADWYQTMRNDYNRDKTLRLFATPAKQFGRSNKYSHANFSRDIFNGFFKDLLVEIRNSNRPRGSLRVSEAIAEEKEFANAWLKGGAGAAAAGISGAGMYELYKMSQKKEKK